MTKRDDHSAQEIQADLSEVERDLTLRRLLWQSQEEWTKLVDGWTATSFDALPVETLQKNVNRYSQTVFMLEKGEHSEPCKDKIVFSYINSLVLHGNIDQTLMNS